MTALFYFSVVGLLAGFLSGLLGIGGGIVMVPSYLFLFPKLGLHEEFYVHMAMATSLSCAFFFTFSGSLAHLRLGNVSLSAIFPLALGGVLGAFMGSWLAGFVPGLFLKKLFAIFLFFSAFRLAFFEPKEGRSILERTKGLFFGVGLLSGVVASFFGVGGGVVAVPTLIFMGFSPVEAVGTSSTLLPFITFFAALGYVFGGLKIVGVSKHTLGFVYIPALFVVVPFGVVGAQLGARLSGSVPKKLLRRMFACLLIVVAVRIFFN